MRISLGVSKLYVCARCSGIVTGILIGLLYVDWLIAAFNIYPILIGAFTLPAAIDWYLQVFRRKDSTNRRRVVTGALLGQTYAAGLIALVRGLPILMYFAIFWAAHLLTMYIVFRYTSGPSDYVRRVWQ